MPNNVKMKLFQMYGAAGGYVMGDGVLPAGFNPDAFMSRLGRKVIEGALDDDPESMDIFNEELDRAIAAAPTIERTQPQQLEDLPHDDT